MKEYCGDVGGLDGDWGTGRRLCDKIQNNIDHHPSPSLISTLPCRHLPALVARVIDFNMQSVISLLIDFDCQRGDG